MFEVGLYFKIFKQWTNRLLTHWRERQMLVCDIISVLFYTFIQNYIKAYWNIVLMALTSFLEKKITHSVFITSCHVPTCRCVPSSRSGAFPEGCVRRPRDCSLTFQGFPASRTTVYSLPGPVFIKHLKSNVYVTLNAIGSFLCNLHFHWLIQIFIT